MRVRPTAVLCAASVATIIAVAALPRPEEADPAPERIGPDVSMPRLDPRFGPPVLDVRGDGPRDLGRLTTTGELRIVASARGTVRLTHPATRRTIRTVPVAPAPIVVHVPAGTYRARWVPVDRGHWRVSLAVRR